jgi:DNA-binding LacI/PurR family transcriptional regulator
MNQREIAKLAGVSVATVSRVINNKGNVSEETLQRVLKVIEENMYVQNMYARNLRTSNSKIIGFLISNLSNPFFAEVYAGLDPACREQGYTVLCGITNEDPIQEKEAIEMFIKYRVDGIVACFVNPSPTTLKMLDNFGIKVIMFDRVIDSYNADTVTFDNIQGGKMQVEYLAKLGHKKIAVIHGLPDSVGRERLKGYELGMESSGIKVRQEYVVSGRYTEEGAYEATVCLMNMNDKPTAIIAHNNLMCMGAYKAIKDLGIDIPNEVSLIGFDDFDSAAYLQPSITLISKPITEMGQESAKMLIQRIKNKSQKDKRSKVFPVYLIERNSCAQRSNM